MRLITPEESLYRATAAELDALETGEPWWAFCWPGSFALAELLQEQPELVRGKRVLDVATGCGISAFASLQAGAAHVIANDIDPWSLDAVRLNVSLAGEEEPWAAGAEQEGRLSYCVDDLIGTDVASSSQQIDVVIAGDICYEQPLADQVHTWLHGLLSSDRPPLVLVGDPGRASFVEAFQPQNAAESLQTVGLDPGRDFPDGSLSLSGSAAVGRALPLRISAVHKSELSGLVADTSHGLHTATVWRLQLAVAAEAAEEENMEGGNLEKVTVAA